MACDADRTMGPADEFYAGVIELARALHADRHRRPSRPKPPPDPSGDALRGTCQRCLVGVERFAVRAPWRTVVAGVNGDRELCDGEDPGRGNVIRRGHGPVTPDHGPHPSTTPQRSATARLLRTHRAWCAAPNGITEPLVGNTSVSPGDE